jgi:pyruvate dehydrogenase E2 component (dihydrolipoamide acetyltransferase)
MAEYLMPSLGADMEAGKLVEWLVKPGSRLKRGDIIAVVETQKGAIEIEVFDDGLFEQPLVELGARVPVGSPLAIISYDNESAGGAKPVRPPAPAAGAPPPVAPPPPVTAPLSPRAAGARLAATPAARRMAAEAGIELSSVKPSGPHGEIVLADLTPAAVASATPPVGGMREAIAAAMSRSKREIPHYYLAHTIEIEAAENFVGTFNADRDPSERLLLGALFAGAVARAAAKYPEFNGHFVDGAYRPSVPVHVGLAINIRGTGLVAPAIHDADQLGLEALMAAMRDLIARVRAGRFRASEISDPTITVSSLGERGVESLLGIIYPPQVAIVGFGMPVTRPWVVEGAVVPRRVVTVTLAGDHRVSDGHRGALLLEAIQHLLAQPEEL